MSTKKHIYSQNYSNSQNHSNSLIFQNKKYNLNCIRFYNGYCRYGEKCFYLHDTVKRRTQKNDIDIFNWPSSLDVNEYIPDYINNRNSKFLPSKSMWYYFAKRNDELINDSRIITNQVTGRRRLSCFIYLSNCN